VHFVVADATRLPFADCEFDLVHTAKTTHHIRDWPQALAEMVRVLRPGGHLIYRDFVASFGDRLPTRRALNSFAREHRLQPVRRTHSPVTYTVILRKCDQGTNARP
jgi:ubiquinone/menaquinone biosynthesis C-methylase UbiE